MNNESITTEAAVQAAEENIANKSDKEEELVEKQQQGLVDSPDYEPSEAVQALDTFNHNLYAQKKTIATGLLDLALMSANASQLKVCLQNGPQKQEFYHVLVPLISISILLQIVTAILFVVIVRRHERHREDEHRAALAYGQRERRGPQRYNICYDDRYQRPENEDESFHEHVGHIRTSDGVNLTNGDVSQRRNSRPVLQVRTDQGFDYTDNDAKSPKIYNTSKINDVATLTVLFITIINVFICGMGMSLHPTA